MNPWIKVTTIFRNSHVVTEDRGYPAIDRIPWSFHEFYAGFKRSASNWFFCSSSSNFGEVVLIENSLEVFSKMQLFSISSVVECLARFEFETLGIFQQVFDSRRCLVTSISRIKKTPKFTRRCLSMKKIIRGMTNASWNKRSIFEIQWVVIHSCLIDRLSTKHPSFLPFIYNTALFL